MLSRLRIGTKIGASFALGLGIFSVIAIASYQGISRLVEASRLEAHTYQVIEQLKELDSQLKGAETGQRGYIITGKDEYLEPYRAALAELDTTLQSLRTLTADNPMQQQRLDAMTPIIKARLDVMQGRIDLRRTQGFEASQRTIAQGTGFKLGNEIEQIRTVMENEERSLLNQRRLETQNATRTTMNSILYGMPLYAILLSAIAIVLARNISRPLNQLADVADRVGSGDLAVNVPDSSRQDEIGILSRAFNQMIANLRETTRKNDEQGWLKSNLAELTQKLQGQRDQLTVARSILSELAPLIGAQHGVFYVLDAAVEPPVLKLLSSYAYESRKQLNNQFHLGEGLVGQCALEKHRILLTEVPDDYIRIRSGLGEIAPSNIVVLPVLFEEQVTAVLEFASLQPFKEIHLTFLEQLTQNIGVVLNTIASDTRTSELLIQSQALTEALQQRQSDLETSYQQLEQQAEDLRRSEALLREQREELQQTNEELQQLNEELEEKAELLALQKREVETKNQEIEVARQELTEKAEQLALSSKYKSEFLANMSHELRTPLNSLLILARLLTDNPDGNLTEKQREYSQTIYSAGNDLLELINDILDLAKIESGMMVLNSEEVLFRDLKLHLERTFSQIAADKGLSFQIQVDDRLPTSLMVDPKRLQQILKNLLSNAFKFTEQGSITLRISLVDPGSADGRNGDRFVVFAVQDTGIGILPDKQKIIFEAFQQADGTTSRKYGGTGLGLSISRQLAYLIGGEISLSSQPGQGSTFTLFLPLKSAVAQASVPIEPLPSPAPPLPALSIPPAPQGLPDDRDSLQAGDRVLLIIEDDLNFARILLEMARKQGFKGIVSLQGRAGALLAQEFKPDAIMLDIRLPDTDGWTILDQLKHNSDTRHIPVHILSVDEEEQRGLQLGAIAYLQKPVSAETINQALANIRGFVERRVKQLLVIEDDPVQAQSIIELIGNGDVKSTAIHTGAEALNLLKSQVFDCIVLDLGLPDMTGFDLLNQMKQDAQLAKLPIIIYTGKELSRQEETELRRFAETIIVKDVRSPERLLDETALFLHRVQANLPRRKQQMLEQLRHDDPILSNKKVLIIDDDVRNIFALTGLLERYQIQVIYAENGRDGIQQLEANPDTNVILMDVMMPEMDGYETTQAIRQQDRFRSLPIIALTAKAMQGDREKCIEAGASDYITKPVDTEQLLSLLRVWLYGRP